MSNGVVQVAGKNKYGAYVKIGDNFFNSGKGLTFDLSSLTKGDAVEFEANGKYINKISVTGKSEVPVSSGFKSSVTTSDKSAEIARSTAVKSVLGSPAIAQAYAKKDISETIQDSKLLIEEFTKYILTGTFKVADDE